MTKTKLVIKTPEGVDVPCLPPYARCECTKKSPEKMDMCPIYRFDTSGYICVPEICENYKE